MIDITASSLVEAVARAICGPQDPDAIVWSGHTEGPHPQWMVWMPEARAALASVAKASGLDANGLLAVADSLTGWPEQMIEGRDSAVSALLRALAEVADG